MTVVVCKFKANFVPISYTSDFLEWSFEEVRPLLKRDSLNVDDDKQVRFVYISFEKRPEQKNEKNDNFNRYSRRQLDGLDMLLAEKYMPQSELYCCIPINIPAFRLLKCVRRFNEKLKDKKFNQTHSAMIDPNFKIVLDNVKVRQYKLFGA